MSILPFALLLSFVLPQAATGPQVANDLVVSSHYYGRVAREILTLGRNSVTREPFDRPVRMRGGPAAERPLRIIQRETHALVRNTGTRTVKSVTWSYVFYEDAARTKELGRAQFATKEKIGPGEMKFLTEQVAKAAPTAYGDVVIDRVEYADGAVWTRTEGQPQRHGED